jgi:hypothetical protein
MPLVAWSRGWARAKPVSISAFISVRGESDLDTGVAALLSGLVVVCVDSTCGTQLLARPSITGCDEERVSRWDTGRGCR